MLIVCMCGWSKMGPLAAGKHLNKKRTEQKRNKARMKKFYSLVLILTAILCGFSNSVWGETKTIADGASTNEYVPFYGWYCDVAQHNQVIYPSSLLEGMEYGTITGLKFYTSNTTAPTWSSTPSATIKLTEVAGTSLSALLAAGSDGTEVLSSKSITLTKEGDKYVWNITLDNSYSYSGGNLLIDISTTKAGYSHE